MERYSSNKKKGWAGVVAAASNIQQNTGQYPKCRLYNEFVDESSQSNQVSPDGRRCKGVILQQVAEMHKMETFNKNDSSSGGEGPRSLNIANQQPSLSFEQNLDLFIQRFSAAGQNANSQNDHLASDPQLNDLDQKSVESEND